MQRRKFGDTQLEVSAISLGCWIFGVDWWGHYTDERALELCRFSYDLGITFFDNGDAYGNGRAETLFGRFLKESAIPRDRIEIGGKFASPWKNPSPASAPILSTCTWPTTSSSRSSAMTCLPN
jgi:aryl-alcohol dehydrogenase-like predicted oxidoreductase